MYETDTAVDGLKAEIDFEIIVAEALNRILDEQRLECRTEMIRLLRQELEKCLAEAPITGNVLDTIGLRARLVRAFQAACSDG